MTKIKENPDLFHHQCRTNCGACCITPSISSPIPSLPNGKPKNFRCPHLNEVLLCAIFNSPDRPKVCANFHFDPMICGTNQAEAIETMSALE